LDDNVKFCSATSNIFIQGAGKKDVEVSIGEIRRRFGAPEYQSSSVVRKLTRFPKTKIHEFERNLVKSGFNIKVNEDMGQATTTTSFLLEADALQLGKDLTKLTSSELSLSVLAAIVADSDGDR
ncbi:hypothetical protein PFISCL1PPCAC_1644, partial [Pristionchus fissidentatus]